MYYCDESESTSWANIDDLYSRYGEEFMDKISTRTIYDSEVSNYVADESTEGRFKVICLALCDAKEFIRTKVSCKFGNTQLLDTASFAAIKQWHIKLTIETLKLGGDCSGCACVVDLDAYLGCARICTDSGVCLPSLKTFFSMSEARFSCECHGGCRCC